MTATELVRRIRAELGGWFWLPCPHCGAYFSGEEWETPERPGDHFSSLPTEWQEDDEHGCWVRTSTGICPACTHSGVGCIAHAAHRVYHPGCEAVPPPEPSQSYVMEERGGYKRVAS